MKIHLSLIVAFSLAFSSFSFGANEVANRDLLRGKFGLTSYAPGTALDQLKIAVLDNGFQGYVPGTGLLPDSAELIEGTVNPQAPTPHGLGMAQIIWAMTGQTVTGPKLYLVNTNGFSNFKNAVDFVIAQHVDIVLYSQVWSFGDNFDGKGFINAEVDRATSAGILWINAAGNFGGMVYNGSVTSQERASDHTLTYPSGLDYLRFQNTLDSNSLTITLTWTDFQDTETYNATKDLDLFIYDESGKLVGSSQLIQHGEAPPTIGTPSQLSSYARETVTLPNLDRGNYRIKVVDKSGNFVSSDQFRVLIDVDRPGSVVFSDRTSGYEIMPPADNPTVFTVGEQTEISSIGPTADGRIKPDAILDDATVTFTNGAVTRGSSNAAAIMTGIVAEMKAVAPALNFDSLSQYATTIRSSSNTGDLGPIDQSTVNPLILAMIPQGGSVRVGSNQHLVILSPVDPLQLQIFKNFGAYRLKPDDILAINPFTNQWYLYASTLEPYLTAPLVEFREALTGTWKTPLPPTGTAANSGTNY
jgi:hypothetical protein